MTQPLGPRPEFVPTDNAWAFTPLNVNVPLSHWSRPDTFYPPEPAGARERYLEAMWRYYAGDLSAELPDAANRRVRPPWFKRVADFIGDLVVTPGPEGLTRRDLKAVRTLAVDLIRFGTAFVAHDGERVRVIEPRGVFPDGQGNFAVVRPAPDQDRTLQSNLVVDLYSDGGGAVRLTRALSIGGQWLETDDAPVDIRPMRIAQLSHNTHQDWGQSIFPDMLPLVAEMWRRLSRTSRLLDRHMEPTLAVDRERGAAPFPDVAPGGKDVRAQELANLLQNPVLPLPAGYSDPRYLVWDAQLQGANAHYHDVLHAMLATTGVPSALWGIVVGGTINSGSALRRLYIPTWTLLSALQSEIIDGLDRVGVTVAEWENALDHVDGVAQAMAAAMAPDQDQDRPDDDDAEDDDDGEEDE